MLFTQGSMNMYLLAFDVVHLMACNTDCSFVFRILFQLLLYSYVSFPTPSSSDQNMKENWTTDCQQLVTNSLVVLVSCVI